MAGHLKDEDYWIGRTRPAALCDSPSQSFTIDVIEGVEPLNDQFGIAKPLTVPSMLRRALFEQPPPANAGAEDKSHTSVAAPLGTFAVLDGAKVQGLPEILVASGLEHACLFQGDAAGELSDVAPWVVRLEEDERFTRHLFTRGHAPWEMWDRAPGIYLRSRDSLKDLRAHLRKFIKVCDESGAWFYLRLYDPSVMRAFLRGAPRFGHRFLTRLSPWNHLTVITCFDSRAEIASPVKGIELETYPIRLGSDEKIVLRQLTFEARAEGLLTALDKGGSISISTNPAVRQGQKGVIVAALHRMYSYGFQQQLQQERWGVWELFYGVDFERTDPTLSRICDTRDMSSGERFAMFQRRLEELYP